MVSAQLNTLVGREPELHHVDQFLDSVAGGPAFLVLEGDAGIGKSTVWQEAIRRATDRACQVLHCRPIQSEAQLAYAALGDLLSAVPDSALGELPPPQRRALDVALMREEPDEQQMFPRAAALGLLGVWRAMSAARPVVVAIDDVQWLDDPSADALAFVARRLTDERVAFLVTRRSEGEPGFPLALVKEHALPDGVVRRARLAAFGPAEIDRLLRTRLGMQAPSRLLERLHATSGGNPFYALEIARSLTGDGPADTDMADVPIPPSLHELVAGRLDALPANALEAVRVASALSRPTAALVDALCAAGGAPDAVRAAVDAQVLEEDGQRLRLAHPLLAAVAYGQLPVTAKRDLHRRIAAVLDDPEERGRHLALATEHPDADIASALEDAARRANARGAPAAAAELWQQARRLTPSDAAEDARRRGIQAAERHFEAGGVDRARALLEEIAAEAPPGRDRALALAGLGWVRAHLDGFAAGTDVFRAALAEHADDVELRIEIEEGLAWCIHSSVGVHEAEVHARAALELAEQLGKPNMLAGALSSVAFASSVRGEGVAIDMIEQAIALGPARQWTQILGRPDWIHALLLCWADDLAASRERFASLHREAVDRGDEHSLPFVLFQLARVELLSGEWAAAAIHASECHMATLQSGATSEQPYALTIEALVEAHLGLAQSAMAKIESGLELVDRLGVMPAGMEMLATRGFLELSLGDADRAVATFAELTEAVERAGFTEPALFRQHGDAIEANVVLGRLEEAAALTAELERLGEVLDRTWVRMIAARSRGLLLAAQGDLARAQTSLEQALVLEQRGEPFERARTLLVLGVVQRRDKKKALARESLSAAAATFEELGASLWEDRARAELARIGGRAASTGLTPTEERVAELIAAGRTYQETAAELFISAKTVQWNLSKIYKKLGIRSRAELPARLAAERDAIS